MKVTLVYPQVNSPGTYHVVGNPVGLMSLGSVLKHSGYLVQILDFRTIFRKKTFSGFRDFYRQAASLIGETGAQIVGFTGWSDSLPTALLLAEECKKSIKDIIAVIGGPQVSFSDRLLLERFPALDIVVRGEGEMTLLQAVRFLDKGRSLSEIPGLSFREDGKVICNPPRNLIEDLDTLPMPDVSLIPNPSDYTAVYVEPGRGCPFSCTFCSTSRMWQRRFRMKSPGRVLEEMRLYARHFGRNEFYLSHDLFTANREYLDEFCRAVRESGEDFQWKCYSRLDTMNSEMLKEMKLSGCSGISLGIESGSKKIQKAIGKNLRLEGAPQLISGAVSQGMELECGFVIGFPEEEESDLEETLSLALKIRLHGVWYAEIFLLIPLPGSELTRRHILEGGPQDYLPNVDFYPRRHWIFGRREKELVFSSAELFCNYYNIVSRHFDIGFLREVEVLFNFLMMRYPASTALLSMVLESSLLNLLRTFRRFLGERKWLLSRPSPLLLNMRLASWWRRFVRKNLKETGSPFVSVLREVFRFEDICFRVESSAPEQRASGEEIQKAMCKPSVRLRLSRKAGFGVFKHSIPDLWRLARERQSEILRRVRMPLFFWHDAAGLHIRPVNEAEEKVLSAARRGKRLVDLMLHERRDGAKMGQISDAIERLGSQGALTLIW